MSIFPSPVRRSPFAGHFHFPLLETSGQRNAQEPAPGEELGPGEVTSERGGGPSAPPQHSPPPPSPSLSPVIPSTVILPVLTSTPLLSRCPFHRYPCSRHPCFSPVIPAQAGIQTHVVPVCPIQASRNEMLSADFNPPRPDPSSGPHRLRQVSQSGPLC